MTTEPDAFDIATFPFGKRAGDNKLGMTKCICGKPGTELPDDYRMSHGQMPTGRFFMFRDELSAKEYYISGMCQACQDSVFGKD